MRPLFSCAGSLFALTFAMAGCGSSSPPEVDAGPRDAPVVDVMPQSTGCQETPTAGPEPTFRGPSAPVEVIRDGMGIPHIYAQNDEDLFFASGYTQAVDRLFQMELMRRTARGTLAEVLGRDKLAQDQLVRLMRVPYWGRESGVRVRREHPEIGRQFDAWVAGVNRRIAEVNRGTVPLPPGFRASEFNFAPEPWNSDDPYLIGRLLLFRNANQLDYDVLATLTRTLAPEATDLPLFQSLTGAFIVPPDERPNTQMARRARPVASPETRARIARFLREMEPFARGASNNWAVAGRHTANGRPMIAGDPHQGLQSPSVFWAQHMNSANAGGTFDVAGFAFAGAPGVHLGHNRRVAWTATTAYPDMMDLWRVPATDESVELGGRRVPVRRCTESIRVKDMAPVAYVIEEVAGEGVLLPSGLTPLPLTSGGDRTLFRWSGFRATDEAGVFFDFNRAQDVGEFDRAVQRMEIGAFNFIAADARDVTYRSHVLVPDRGEPRTMLPSNALLDGTNARTLWTGAFLPADRQPHSRGMSRGFLASANNDPFGFTSNGRTDDDPWFYGTWFDPGTRAARIEQELTRLTRDGGVTYEHMQALQLDTHSVLADEILPSLDAAWTAAQTDPALAMYRDDASLAALYTQLRQWDRRMDRASTGAPVFEGFAHFFALQCLGDDFNLLFDAVLTREPVYILKLLSLTVNRRFPMAERYLQGGRDVLALRALAATRDWIVRRFGSIEPAQHTWAMFHRSRSVPSFTPPGPFETEAVATDGSIGTVNVSQAVFMEGGTPRQFHESRAGAAYRMVVGFNEDGTPSARVNFPRGNSGDPTSRWWANTHEDWVAGRYRALAFSRQAVVADMQERSMIMP